MNVCTSWLSGYVKIYMNWCMCYVYEYKEMQFQLELERITLNTYHTCLYTQLLNFALLLSNVMHKVCVTHSSKKKCFL